LTGVFKVISVNDLLKVRELYYKAYANKIEADSFYCYLKNSPAIDRSLFGYTGLSYMMKANFAWNPYNKLQFFNKGKQYLDGAIKMDPKNVELRFLRT